MTRYIPKDIEFRVDVLDVKCPVLSDSERQASSVNKCGAQIGNI